MDGNIHMNPHVPHAPSTFPPPNVPSQDASLDPDAAAGSASRKRPLPMRAKAPGKAPYPAVVRLGNLYTWGVREVIRWLESLNVGQEALQRFEEEEISGEALVSLSEADLSSLGCTKLGPRKVAHLAPTALQCTMCCCSGSHDP